MNTNDKFHFNLIITLFLLTLPNFSFSQSSFIGIKVRPFQQIQAQPFNNIQDFRTEYGLTYNHMINEQHGLATDLCVNRLVTTTDFDRIDLNGQVTPVTLKLVSVNLNLGLHYLYQNNNWFIQTGPNIQLFDAIFTTYEDDVIQNRLIFEDLTERMTVEYHIQAGRIFDFSRFQLRTSVFLNGAHWNANYFQYGGSVEFYFKID